MDENQFQFLADSYVYRLGELAKLIEDLGRPLLCIRDHDDPGSGLAMQMLEASFGLARSKLSSRYGESGLQTLCRIIPLIPAAGETVLIEAAPGTFSQDFLASLDLDGVLVFRTSCHAVHEVPESGAEMDGAIRILSSLVEMLELATDPEMELEGQEEHEAQSLRKRLENPRLDSARRHAPVIPRGLRAFPYSLLDPAQDSTRQASPKIPGQFSGTLQDLARIEEFSGSSRGRKCLVIISALSPFLLETSLANATASSYPRKSELHAALSALKLQIHEISGRNPAQHHLYPIWAALASWTDPETGDACEKIPDRILVVEDAWYDRTGLLSSDTSGPRSLKAIKLAECAWMEELLVDSGIVLLKIAFAPD